MEDLSMNFIDINIPKKQDCYNNILHSQTTIDILNDDCLTYIFELLSVVERIKVERVCKRWQKVSWNSWKNCKTFNFSREIWGISRHNVKIMQNINVIYEVLKRCGIFIKNLEFFGYLDEFLIIGTKIGSLCPNLQCIDLSGASHLIIKSLADNCNNIRELRLRDTIDPCEEELSLLFLRNKKLKYLEFICEDKQSVGKFLLSLSPESFQTLNIISSNISVYYFNKAIRKLKNLLKLSFDFCDNLNNETIEIISNLSNLQEIQTGRWLGHVTSLNSLTKLSNLTTVEFSYSNYVNDEFLIDLSKNCRKLLNVNIASCNVTDIGVFYITSLPKLERLNVDYLNITDKAFSSMPNLKVIDCFKCKNITNKCFSKILEASEILELINACYCKISNPVIIDAIKITKKRINNIVLKFYVRGTRIKMRKVTDVSPLLRVIHARREFKAKYYL